jgi:hypothetical protein
MWPTHQRQVRKTPLLPPFLYKSASFYQGRLGTDIGKTLKRGRVSAEFLADALMPFSESPAAYIDQRNDTNRVVWNAVMLTRMSSYWSEAFGYLLRPTLV